MSDEFREDVKSVVRRHDPSADELRALASDLQDLADRYDRQDDIL
jgi:hypothetical protein